MSKTITGVMPIRTVGLTPGHRWCGGLRSVKPAVNNGKGARGLVQGPNSLNASYTHPGRISGRPRKLARDLRNRHLDDEGAYLDGRTEHAKKFSFIVMADFLTPGEDVKADWSDFHANQRVNAVREAVHRHVIKEIEAQLATTRKERKKNAIENSREFMGELPTISKKAIGQFIDEVQEKCPTI